MQWGKLQVVQEPDRSKTQFKDNYKVALEWFSIFKINSYFNFYSLFKTGHFNRDFVFSYGQF